MLTGTHCIVQLSVVLLVKMEELALDQTDVPVPPTGLEASAMKVLLICRIVGNFQGTENFTDR